MNFVPWIFLLHRRLRCDIPVVLGKSQNYTADAWSQNTNIYIYIYIYVCVYIYIYIEQTMVTAINYMFRPLTGHHRLYIQWKVLGGYTVYNVTSVWSDRSYIVYCTATQLFSLNMQPDDDLSEAETCSCYLLPSSAIYIYIYIYV